MHAHLGESITKLLLLGRAICCGPRQLGEIGGGWQRISLDLGWEEGTAHKVTPQLVQEGALSKAKIQLLY